MNRIVKYSLVFILFLLLFVVRGFATKLFYDPLIVYFQNDYLYTTIPNVDIWHLIVNLFFRYSINTIISLTIIWLIFQKKNYVKFAVFFYMLAFIVLIIPFVFFLRNNFENGYLLPFYIRRFLIQPLFLLLLLPAFYYQQLNKE